MGLCGLVETCLNISLSTAYLLTQPWTLGLLVCRVNCFLMEVLPGIYTATLLLLLLDRTRALSVATHGGHRKVLSTCLVFGLTCPDQVTGTTRTKVVLVFLWLLHITLCVPILLGVVEAWPFPRRYSCQVQHPGSPPPTGDVGAGRLLRGHHLHRLLPPALGRLHHPRHHAPQAHPGHHPLQLCFIKYPMHQ